MWHMLCYYNCRCVGNICWSFFYISLLLVSQQGRSALFVAAERGYDKVVQILVKSGEKNDVLDEVVIYIAVIMRLFVECNMIVSLN
jgi:hypothetical protein